MILLSGDPNIIFYVLGFFIIVFFIVWTILFYFLEKIKVLDFTNKAMKRIAYFSFAVIVFILSLGLCWAILDML